MKAISLSYLQELAKQAVFLSAFLGGFSATFLGTILVSKLKSNLANALIITLSLASASFIVSVIALTMIVVVLGPDSPYHITSDQLLFPRLLGFATFMLGTYTLIIVIGISGWIRSRSIGIVTTLIAIIASYLIFNLTVS